ncbi:MAG: 50S ribosomal protein L17 [Bacteroidota bacterium]
MRHGDKVNNLGRKSSHRKAMISNMACSLIRHKRINTTIAKAKALKVFVEPLLTKSKTDSTHSRRVVFSYLQDKEIVTELFREVAPKISSRNGGYTRIIKTGYRVGDNAEMCLIELVDFNEIYSNDSSKKTTRRSRRGGTKKVGDINVTESTENDDTTDVVVDVTSAEVVEDISDAIVVEEVAESTEEASTDVTEDSTEEQNNSTEESASSEGEEPKKD